VRAICFLYDAYKHFEKYSSVVCEAYRCPDKRISTRASASFHARMHSTFE
jgi:hypothetical protein